MAAFLAQAAVNGIAHDACVGQASPLATCPDDGKGNDLACATPPDDDGGPPPGYGPLRTGGACRLGRTNHRLGAAALAAGRISRSTPGAFPDVDFCRTPAVICEAEDEDLLWSVALAEWAERVQRYRAGEGRDRWDYREQLVAFVDNGERICMPE